MLLVRTWHEKGIGNPGSDMHAFGCRYFHDCEQVVGQVPDFVFPGLSEPTFTVAMHSVDAAVKEMLQSLQVR
jgi:hypothetical protein